MSMQAENEISPLLRGKHVAFVGKLGGLTKREAQGVVREHGGIPVETVDKSADVVVIGADELPLGDEHLLGPDLCHAAATGCLEIIAETQLWQRLGLVDEDHDRDVRRLYTPAMLADLLNVSVAIIRRWHRRGLIVPVREVRRLPYFEFTEVSTARHLAQLLTSGAAPAEIEKKLEQLARFLPDVERPLAQLSVIVEGKEILLRQGEGLIETGGQLRIDFSVFEETLQPDDDASEMAQAIVAFDSATVNELCTPEEIIAVAAELDERGELDAAINMYRAAQAAGGSRAEICFQIAELLYRQGEIAAARERYYMAVELDEDYVEARANLGCILSELGQHDLAIAAFRGALAYHHEYPDVHYHLARLLDDCGSTAEAEMHWRTFLSLAPDSPWAEEAQNRIEEPW